MLPVYASTGAFITRKNGRNIRLVETVAPEIHADGFEFLMFDSWNDNIGEIRKILKNAPVRFPVMHLDKAIGDALSERGADGEDDAMRFLSRDIETALAIGAKKLVLHLWNGPSADDRFDAMLPAASRFFDLAKSAQLELTIENVISRSFTSLERLRTLSEYDSRLVFTYDTKMAHLKNENALLKDDEWRFLFSDHKISHLHVNDSSVLRHNGARLAVLHMGEGDVDFESFFGIVKETGFSGTLTVESTSVREDGTVEVEKLNNTLSKVRAFLKNR